MVPFDFKELVAKIAAKSLDVKGAALNLAEDEAQIVADCAFDWVVESLILTPNKYDDIAIAFLAGLKGQVKQYIDKIDGKVG